MAKAIALIVAGSGEVTEDEVTDLLNDAYPADDYEEIGLIVPVDKSLFTTAVQNTVSWYNADGDVYPIQSEGASLTRASAKLGDQEGPLKVEKFADILDPKEHADWDEVHFLIALPEDDADDFDTYVDLVETAIENGLTVKNLSRALDDVTLAEPEPEADPEPEPEPEKPARKSRARKRPEPEPDEKIADQVPETQDVHDDVSAAVREISELPKVGLDDRDILTSFFIDLREAVDKALSGLLPGEDAPEAEQPPQEPAEAAEAPKRGRGRPRTDFDVRQIWDEDTEGWVPRPKGRLRKGTKWRTIHADTDETLDEGTA